MDYLRRDDAFVAAVLSFYSESKKLTDSKIRAMAKDSGLNDMSYTYELVEFANCLYYSDIFANTSGWDAKLEKAWNFYSKFQASYNQSSSKKMQLQQYSTAGPIAVVASYFLMDGKEKTDGLVFEPSAGTGLLVHPFDVKQVYVNELDILRFELLRQRNFAVAIQQDATFSFPASYYRKFDVVVSNPPFGNQIEVPSFGKTFFPLPKAKLDHWMVANALECLKDDGKAALIIGDWTSFNEKGWVEKDRLYFNWLYKHYHVVDMVNVNSAKLYNKQGTAYPLRLILINGRKKRPFGESPRKDSLNVAVEGDIFELLGRVKNVVANLNRLTLEMNDVLQKEIGKIQLELKKK